MDSTISTKGEGEGWCEVIILHNRWKRQRGSRLNGLQEPAKSESAKIPSIGNQLAGFGVTPKAMENIASQWELLAVDFPRIAQEGEPLNPVPILAQGHHAGISSLTRLTIGIPHAISDLEISWTLFSR